MNRRLAFAVILVVAPTLQASADVVLVRDNSPWASIVVADDAPTVALYAAGELAEHIHKATGAMLEIVPESQAPANDRPRVYVGVTNHASEHGVIGEFLGPDAFALKVVGNDVYVSGAADGDDPQRRSAGSNRGTLWGVYELLDRYVGVKWLWPGELGTYIPQLNTIAIPVDLDERVEPPLRFRRWRGHQIRHAAQRYDERTRRIAFSEEGIKKYAYDLSVYKRRHRAGDTYPKPTVGHHFSDWWERHGEDNPEWFMMNTAGKRGPLPGQSENHVAMCVSNPDLHRYIVQEAWDGGDELRLGEVDRRVFCQCENCRAWDAPQGQAPRFAPNLWSPQMVTNRYARFWMTIQEMASRRNPNVTITTFLYWNYLPAPHRSLRLNKRIYGEFVPWGQNEIVYFPMNPEAFEWLKQQWLGWSLSGITIAYRPNYLHGGYVMPHLSTRQVGEFFQFAYEHGMIGFDQDSLYGHWATKGPMLYLHMRLGVNPLLDIERVLDEYYEAFGPARDSVREYFEYWEAYSATRPGGNLYNPIDTHVAYPPRVFVKAREILDAAQAQAKQSPREEYAQRVEFLQAGLEHARLAARFWASLNMGHVPIDAKKLQQARQALADLVAFRRQTEHLYIADFINAAARENRRTNIDVLLEPKGPDEVASTVLAPWKEWTFRMDADDVGVDNAWFNPDDVGGDQWLPIEVPAHWSKTHVGGYLGTGWYRTTFDVPDHLHNQPLNILFQGVDEQAWIYVNGLEAGRHTVESQGLTVDRLWNRPFTIELGPEQLKARDNVLVIRVHASAGQGGIWSPVLLYAPDDLD